MLIGWCLGVDRANSVVEWGIRVQAYGDNKK